MLSNKDFQVGTPGEWIHTKQYIGRILYYLRLHT